MSQRPRSIRPHLVDPLKFTTIAHSGRSFLAPIDQPQAARLVASLELQSGEVVADLGCGKGAFLAEMLRSASIQGAGYDHNEAFLQTARTSTAWSGIRCQLMDIRFLELEPASLDVFLCTGATEPLDGLDQTLAMAHSALRPGGRALIAEPYWQQTPPQGYLDFLGAESDSLHDLAGTVERSSIAGFELRDFYISSQADWDDYERSYAFEIRRHLSHHRQDPDHEAMRDRIDRWQDAYFKWGRSTMGLVWMIVTKKD
jgi:SAM-dependent methyltransferase